jgi:hypothetical protein
LQLVLLMEWRQMPSSIVAYFMFDLSAETI